MKHYMLLKLAPGADIQKAEERIWKTYEKLDKELTWLNYPKVFRSCAGGESDADIMVVADLDSDENLQSYLTHPLYLEMEEDLKDVVVGRTSFAHY